MKVKKLLKTILGKMAALNKSTSHMNVETAKTILQSLSPDPATTCVATNMLKQQYDLQIIVPSYNMSKYVASCLESVLNQKTKYSYLVTVVNDGSTDQTLEIVRSYQKKYSNRMEVINQQNRGLSGARNAAMKILKGKYITFLDSDDILVDGAVEAWLHAALDGNSALDIVQGSWYTSVQLNVGEIPHDVQVAQQLSGFPWGKIFKAEILEHFQFPEGYWFEDTPISFMIYGKQYNFKAIPDVVYGYRLNPEGITAKSIMSKRSVESYYITELCLREFPVFDVPYDQRAYEYFLNQCIMNWRRTSKQPKKVREAIFVLEAELKGMYFKDMNSQNNKEVETVLCKKQFGRFEALAWGK
jgi:glycosyltransferase involved in cell wall biosynthesis